MTANKPVRVIAVASGKGGVGKTNVSVNLAVTFAELGRQVVLMDADLGLANVDIMLGLQPSHNLEHVITGECTLDEILVPGPANIKIIPAASGTQRMSELTPAEHVGLIRAFSDIQLPLDTLIVDTAAVISDMVVSFCRASQDVVIVVCDEPASITDAYALIKLLNKEYQVFRFHILVNMVHSAQEARNLFAKLTKVTDRYLDVLLDFTGAIPYDQYLRKAVQRQRAVVQAFPRSRAAQAFKSIGKKVDNWPMPRDASGQMSFFIERFIQYNSGAGDSML
ncbi:MAG: MinD/ParA family protein [Methylococcales bacterium]|nr:MinD/ParA family protein [Methylococcales bacterium]